MGSDNLTSADDQQETEHFQPLELDARWVVGFIDGEGCFCVSLHRNPTFAKRTHGWQLHPAFQAYQHQVHRPVLEALVGFFGCGVVRPKGPRSSVLTYSVDTMRDLSQRVIPFFEHHPLLVKQADFERFASIVRSMQEKEHFTDDGFERIVRLAYAMNAHGKQRARTIEEVLGILRDCTPGGASQAEGR